MKTILTLYPKFEDPIEITIIYVPALDGSEVEGYWNFDNNQVWLSYRMYRDFSKIEKQSEKKSFFDKLLKVSSFLIK